MSGIDGVSAHGVDDAEAVGTPGGEAATGELVSHDHDAAAAERPDASISRELGAAGLRARVEAALDAQSPVTEAAGAIGVADLDATYEVGARIVARLSPGGSNPLPEHVPPGAAWQLKGESADQPGYFEFELVAPKSAVPFDGDRAYEVGDKVHKHFGREKGWSGTTPEGTRWKLVKVVSYTDDWGDLYSDTSKETPFLGEFKLVRDIAPPRINLDFDRDGGSFLGEAFPGPTGERHYRVGDEIEMPLDYVLAGQLPDAIPNGARWDVVNHDHYLHGAPAATIRVAESR